MRFGGACLLLMGLLIGGFCVPALPFASGLAGTRGTLTVESHRVSYSSKGSTTSSEGTFRSDDGKITDHRAEVDPNFALLRRVPVSRAPWASYYVVHPARFLGWLAGSCLAVCFLLLGGPGLVSGRRLSRDAPAPGGEPAVPDRRGRLLRCCRLQCAGAGRRPRDLSPVVGRRR
ncbi:hypothetical protein GCM10020000_24680 [Streptomyces olivoverticillatus]